MIAASSATMPLATNALTMKRARSLWFTKAEVLRTQFPSPGRLGSLGFAVDRRCRRKINLQPIAYHAPHAIVIFGKHEVVDATEQMQFGRLPRALEHFDRLFGRRHRVVGAVQQQQWSRRNPADHLVGAKIEHALG